MKTIKITILASDILEGNYVIPRQCAMTKAFHRAGLSYHEGGGEIVSDYEWKNRFTTPTDLEEKVIAMYSWADRDNISNSPDKWILRGKHIAPIEPVDFDYELTIPD
jgi:hypothetical protein